MSSLQPVLRPLSIALILGALFAQAAAADSCAPGDKACTSGCDPGTVACGTCDPAATFCLSVVCASDGNSTQTQSCGMAVLAPGRECEPVTVKIGPPDPTSWDPLLGIVRVNQCLFDKTHPTAGVGALPGTGG